MACSMMLVVALLIVTVILRSLVEVCLRTLYCPPSLGLSLVKVLALPG